MVFLVVMLRINRLPFIFVVFVEEVNPQIRQIQQREPQDDRDQSKAQRYEPHFPGKSSEVAAECVSSNTDHNSLQDHSN